MGIFLLYWILVRHRFNTVPIFHGVGYLFLRFVLEFYIAREKNPFRVCVFCGALSSPFLFMVLGTKPQGLVPAR